MKKILFIDRDGTIIKEPPVDFQVDKAEKLEFLPDVLSALRGIVETTDYRLVMVTNQDGLGTDAFPTEDFLLPHTLMQKVLQGEKIFFDEELIDSSFPEENSPNRKPGIGMVAKYMNEYLDYENSYVIGDRLTDMQLAKNMGIKGIFIGKTDEEGACPIALESESWKEIATFLKQGARKAKVNRRTNETAINIELDLNGTGACRISTGIAFFDHMLEQIAKHGGVDLVIDVKGDLEVDEHHTIEDTGIALGECFLTALGAKKGVERYGFALPMDEAHAQVLLDFGGRAHLVWKVEFNREYVGDFPTEMTKHFFEAFCQSCKCNLNISADGENMHHIIEGIFKAFARSIKSAIKITGTAIPSSKGVL